MGRHAHQDPLPAELDEVGRLLTEQRLTADPVQLDRLKLEARARVARRPSPWLSLQKGSPLTSRLSILLMLVLGFVMTGAGAAVGVTSLAVDSNRSASALQYQEDDDDDGNGRNNNGNGRNNNGNGRDGNGNDNANDEVLPAGPVGGGTPNDDEGGTAGRRGSGGTPTGGGVITRPAVDQGVQVRRQQVAASDDGGSRSSRSELPFTGLAAIPLLIVGALLLASGLVLRRRSA
jgi:hypothetical protein